MKTATRYFQKNGQVLDFLWIVQPHQTWLVSYYLAYPKQLRCYQKFCFSGEINPAGKGYTEVSQSAVSGVCAAAELAVF